MDRALDLKPEVTQGCGFESQLWQEVSTTEVRPLSKAPNPPTAPRAPQCRLPTAPLGWVKCREHISLLIILCIIVYVTNKAHLSLIMLMFGHLFLFRCVRAVFMEMILRCIPIRRCYQKWALLFPALLNWPPSIPSLRASWESCVSECYKGPLLYLLVFFFFPNRSQLQLYEPYTGK